MGQKQTNQELTALLHINSIITASSRFRHIGTTNIQALLDQFKIGGPQGNLCLVYMPLAMSIAEMRKTKFDG